MPILDINVRKTFLKKHFQDCYAFSPFFYKIRSSSSEISQMCRRFITLKKSDPNMLGAGFSFIGGNAVGIYIHEIYHDCFVEGGHQLQRGDHILEVSVLYGN